MISPKPIYTPENCNPSYKLYWSLSIFWQDKPISSKKWFEALKPLTEKDGVRILEYRQKDDITSQFLLSTQSKLSPSEVIRSVKGRLQHQIRVQIPKAFKGNYSIKSIGSTKIDIVQEYLDTQLEHHRMTDPKVQNKLVKYQIDHPSVKLNVIRRSAHGQFIYNLHLVLVHAGRWREIRDERLAISRDMIDRTAVKRGHLLSKARLLPDHLHLTLGCDVKESPLDVGLG
ncbi:MAG: hypothetical protein GWO08_19590, partial [Gammaproteobacteria bacterium]|nr:hypothetical protein [Gammaproteobacteria bacterium]NIW44413.1 hypothetical protein [Gammaproteobacteria bacterium]